LKRLDRYLMATVLGGALLALAIIIALLLVFEYMEEFDDIGRGNYTALGALTYVLLKLPHRLYQGYPMAALIGSLMGLGALAANSELTAMRAAGMSVARIARAVVAAGLLLGLGALAIGEWLAPPAERMAQELRSIAIHDRSTIASPSAIVASGPAMATCSSRSGGRSARNSWPACGSSSSARTGGRCAS